MRSKTRWFVLVGLATSSLALVHCVGDEPVPVGGDGDGGGDASSSDTFVPPTDSGPTDSGVDAATLCSASANGVTCGAAASPCIIQIAGGGQTFCARDTDCNVYCWGDNRDGQLATDPAATPFSATPLKVNLGTYLGAGVDVGGGFDPTLMGQSAVCTRVAPPGGGPYGVMCWGANQFGQLGIPDAGSQVDTSGFAIGTTPVLIPNLTSVVTIMVGAMHSCAITATPSGAVGLFDCWGNNNHGELGRVTPGNTDPTPQPSGATPIGFDGLATVGYQHTCVINSSNHVVCTGRNDFDQLGNDGGGDNSDASTYSVVPGLVSIQVTAAGTANCALTKTGSLVTCWGNNTNGELGNDTFVTPNPVPASPPDLPPSSAGGVQAGARNFCANYGITPLADAGSAPRIYCWGANDVGESIIPTDGGDLPTATPLSGLPNGKVVHLAMGGQGSCALMGDGTVWCWGENYHGELGNRGDGGNDSASLPPAQVHF